MREPTPRRSGARVNQAVEELRTALRSHLNHLTIPARPDDRQSRNALHPHVGDLPSKNWQQLLKVSTTGIYRIMRAIVAQLHRRLALIDNVLHNFQQS